MTKRCWRYIDCMMNRMPTNAFYAFLISCTKNTVNFLDSHESSGSRQYPRISGKLRRTNFGSNAKIDRSVLGFRGFCCRTVIEHKFVCLQCSDVSIRTESHYALSLDLFLHQSSASEKMQEVQQSYDIVMSTLNMNNAPPEVVGIA